MFDAVERWWAVIMVSLGILTLSSIAVLALYIHVVLTAGREGVSLFIAVGMWFIGASALWVISVGALLIRGYIKERRST